MHALLEFLIEAVSWLGFRPERTDRSVVGESELDRSARRLWWIVSLVLLAAAAVALLLVRVP